MARTYEVLFLCTGNSARSILAEAILGVLGKGRFRAYSAGSQPQGRVHPLALELLASRDYDVSGLRSKSWDEFGRESEATLDFVFTVCDNAANETCPVWPGQPLTAHWGIADPAVALEGTKEEQLWLFRRAYIELHRRIELFTCLPIESLDRLALTERLEEIGKTVSPAGDEE